MQSLDVMKVQRKTEAEALISPEDDLPDDTVADLERANAEADADDLRPETGADVASYALTDETAEPFPESADVNHDPAGDDAPDVAFVEVPVPESEAAPSSTNPVSSGAASDSDSVAEPEPLRESEPVAAPIDPIDQFDTVGAFLAAVRRERGLSSSDIETALKVKADYVDAIESGDHRALPGEPFNSGFVRSYARLLGLNVDAVSRRYKSESAPTVMERLTPTDEVHEPIELPWRGLGLAALGALLVAVVWWGVQPRERGEFAAVPPVPETLRDWASEAPGEVSVRDLVRSDGPSVTLRAKVDTRITVRAPSGDIVFDAPLARDQDYDVPDFVGLEVAAPNAGAIEVVRAGEPMGRMGVPGVPVSAWSVDEARTRLVAEPPAAAEEAPPVTASPPPAKRAAPTPPRPAATKPPATVRTPASAPTVGRSAQVDEARSASDAALPSVLPPPTRLQDLPPIAPVSTTPPPAQGEGGNADPFAAAPRFSASSLDPALPPADAPSANE